MTESKKIDQTQKVNEIGARKKEVMTPGALLNELVATIPDPKQRENIIKSLIAISPTDKTQGVFLDAQQAFSRDVSLVQPVRKTVSVTQLVNDINASVADPTQRRELFLSFVRMAESEEVSAIFRKAADAIKEEEMSAFEAQRKVLAQTAPGADVKGRGVPTRHTISNAMKRWLR